MVVWCHDQDTYVSCSWHQTTKPPILFSPIFSTNVSPFEQLKKKTNILLVQNRFFFSVLDQWKVCFLFQLLKKRKIRGKKWGNQDWLFGNWMSGTRKTFIFIEFIHRFVTEFVKLYDEFDSCYQIPPKWWNIYLGELVQTSPSAGFDFTRMNWHVAFPIGLKYQIK